MTASAVPFVFSPNTLIQSAQVNADFTSVVGSLNNIDAAQITTGVLPVSNGGTGVTTPGAITTSIGAVAKTGDTMTGSLTVPAIVYSIGPGHGISFGWDGQLQGYVDGTYIGAIGDITSVLPGNGLTGGGASGALTLAMSGSYSGNFTASGSVNAAYLNSTGDGNVSGLFNTGYLGVFNNAQVNGTINCNGALSTGSALSVAGQTTTGAFYTAGTYGIGDWKFYVTSEIWCARHIIPVSDGGVYCGLVAFPWAGVFAYSYVTSSDPALKHDIEPVPPGCLDLVNAIEPKTYKLNLEASDTVDQQERDRTHWGFLAPDVGTAMQRAGLKFDGARDEGDGHASLAYNDMIAVLWKAVQELTAKVAALEAARGAS